MKKWITLILTAIALSGQAQAPKITEQRIREFDSYVDKVRKEWDVPGLSMAVVKNGKVIFKKGYGIRTMGTTGAVDTETLFACASTTKAMTVTVLGMLVDQGKIGWDDLVSTYIPELKLHDEFVTRELRVRDLLLHNTGLPSTNFLWTTMNISADEMFRRLQYVEPLYSFRSGFEYQNTFYTIAGRVIERVSGKSWNEAMTTMLFQPLGMKSTVPQRSLSTNRNITRPHFEVNDTIRIMDYGRESEVGAAGAVWSNADDMSRWMIAMLDSSKYAGGRLLQPKTWREVFKPQAILPDMEYPTFSVLKPNWRTYGLGWYQHDYRGKKVNFHTGSLTGLTAIIGLLPEENIGVYIFGNLDHAEVRHALMYKTFDWFALGGDRDWNGEFKVLYTGLKKQQAESEAAFVSRRVANTRTSLPLASYSGTYESELYGKVDVLVEDNELHFRVNGGVWDVTLSHWHYDTFRGAIGNFGEYTTTATFHLDNTGSPSRLEMADMAFERVKSGQ
jgi:CubicO group peptidase (beta-lactamase class C family)